MYPEFQQNLADYAQLTLEVGLNLQANQHVVFRFDGDMAAPHLLEFMRLLTKGAYKMGARSVQLLWGDDKMALSKWQHQSPEYLAEFWTSTAQFYLEAVDKEAAYLHVSGADPQIFSSIYPLLMVNSRRAFRETVRPFQDAQGEMRFPWCIIDFPTPAWAKRVFPELSVDVALEKLWKLIFQVVRVGEGNATARWKEHNARLSARAKMLTREQFSAIHFHGFITDLTVGLVENHVWLGGPATSSAGIQFTPNLPTEEVFTLPHREKVSGTVLGTKAVSIFGTLVQDFVLEFEAGKVVNYSAGTGQDALKTLLEYDEGSSFLGEVALVAHSSPISQTGVVFQSILLDENASCHIAVGSHYADNLAGGVELSEAERATKGANVSKMHLDLMIGSGQVDVFGVRADGSKVALLEGGDWVF
jgi:aminopeptidase